MIVRVEYCEEKECDYEWYVFYESVKFKILWINSFDLEVRFGLFWIDLVVIIFNKCFKIRICFI